MVVTNDPEDESSSKLVQDTKSNGEDNVRIFRDLLKELSKGQKDPHTDETLEGQGFGELRDALLAFDPLNGDHVKLINSAEAQFWKKSEGYQIRPSDELLQFDCGGQVSTILQSDVFCVRAKMLTNNGLSLPPPSLSNGYLKLVSLPGHTKRIMEMI